MSKRIVLLIGCMLATNYVVAQEELSGDKFQHVTALHDMPASQMGKVMNIMSDALGVSCKHCHAGYDFAKEDVAKKAIARKMIEMTLKMNREHFGGRAAITCMTCHQGQPIPPNPALSATALAGGIPKTIERIVQKASESPSDQGKVKSILERYHQSLQQEPNSASRPTRRLQGSRVEPNGTQESLELLIHGPSSWEETTQYGQLKLTERWQNEHAEKLEGEKPIELKADEAAHIRIESHLALGKQLDSLFPRWEFLGDKAVVERPADVLQAIDGPLTHQFHFDRQTGQLLRRTATISTVLGAHVLQVDYSSYQFMAGQLRPRESKFTMPGVSWTRVLKAEP